MRSASMDRKSTPSCRRGNSPNPTPFSKPSRRSCNVLPPHVRVSPLRLHRIRPLNFRRRLIAAGWEASAIEISMTLTMKTNVGLCSRRVMGAWWPSRSSKPLSARSTGRGMFDSYPLRHFDLRFAICDLRFEHTAQRASADDPFVYRKSQIVNSRKGGGSRVARSGP